MSEDFEQALESVDNDRRVFLKKMVVGTAFAVPVVSSFSMAGVQAAFAQTPAVSATTTSGAPGATPTTSATTTTTQGNTTTTTTIEDSDQEV